MTLQQQSTAKLDTLYKAIQTLPNGPDKAKLMVAANDLDTQLEGIRELCDERHMYWDEEEAI